MNLKAVREHVVNLLKNRTDAGDRVYSGRLDAFEEDELPAIDIFTPSDLPGDGLVISTLEIWIFVRSGPGEDVNDNADILQAQVAEALDHFWEHRDAQGQYTATYTGRDFQYDIEGKWPHAISKRSYQLESLNE